MVIKSSDLHRELIRKTLEHHAGKSPDAEATAEAALNVWRKMSAQLAPLLGEKGVNVLFRRTLHLTRTSFRWLTIPEGDNAALLTKFKADLKGRETADAFEASVSLLTTFIELLATLIGESLTGRLLSMALAPRSRVITKENIS
jgi:hypothetical protein